jgi:hypothetical protein
MQGTDLFEEINKMVGMGRGKPSAASVIFNIAAIYGDAQP